MMAIREWFESFHSNSHPIMTALSNLNNLDIIRTIEGANHSN